MAAPTHARRIAPAPPRTWALVLAVALSTTLPAAAATASEWIVQDEGHHHRAQQLSALVLLRPDATALGIDYAIPVAHDGLIPHLNDAFAIELGASLGAWHDGYYWDGTGATVLSLSFGAGVRWDFFLTAEWAVFASLKLGLEYGLPPYQPEWIVPMGTLGGLYRLDEALLLRLEVGYPGGIGVGLAFLFDRP